MTMAEFEQLELLKDKEKHGLEVKEAISPFDKRYAQARANREERANRKAEGKETSFGKSVKGLFSKLQNSAKEKIDSLVKDIRESMEKFKAERANEPGLREKAIDNAVIMVGDMRQQAKETTEKIKDSFGESVKSVKERAENSPALQAFGESFRAGKVAVHSFGKGTKLVGVAVIDKAGEVKDVTKEAVVQKASVVKETVSRKTVETKDAVKEKALDARDSILVASINARDSVRATITKGQIGRSNSRIEKYEKMLGKDDKKRAAALIKLINVRDEIAHLEKSIDEESKSVRSMDKARSILDKTAKLEKLFAEYKNLDQKHNEIIIKGFEVAIKLEEEKTNREKLVEKLKELVTKIPDLPKSQYDKDAFVEALKEAGIIYDDSSRTYKYKEELEASA